MHMGVLLLPPFTSFLASLRGLEDASHCAAMTTKPPSPTCIRVSSSLGEDSAGVPVRSTQRLARCSSGRQALVRLACGEWEARARCVEKVRAGGGSYLDQVCAPLFHLM